MTVEQTGCPRGRGTGGLRAARLLRSRGAVPDHGGLPGGQTAQLRSWRPVSRAKPVLPMASPDTCGGGSAEKSASPARTGGATSLPTSHLPLSFPEQARRSPWAAQLPAQLSVAHVGPGLLPHGAWEGGGSLALETGPGLESPTAPEGGSSWGNGTLQFTRFVSVAVLGGGKAATTAAS